MAKFCSKCGSNLPESGICQCQIQSQPVFSNQQNANAQQFVPPQAVPPQFVPPQGYVQPIIEQTPSAAGIYFKKLWKLIIALFKTPVTVGTQFTNACDYKVAFGLIGAQALAVALLFMSLAAKINAISSKYDAPSDQQFSIVTIFLVCAIATYAMALIMPAVIMMFVKMFKGQTTYKHMLCVSGISSITTTPFIIIALILSVIISVGTPSLGNAKEMVDLIINPFIFPILVALLGSSLSQFVALKAMRGGANIKEDNTVYVLFLTGVVMAIALYFTIKIVLPMCLPSDILDGIQDVGWLR